MATVIIRPATDADIHSVSEIHAHYVRNTVATFSLVPNTDFEALSKYNTIRSSGLPYLVAHDTVSNDLLGYCYASPFRSAKGGYVHSVELSLFCHSQSVGKGAGTALLTRMIDVLRDPEQWEEQWIGHDRRGEEKRVLQIILCMALDETGLQGGWGLRDWYERFGFVQVGHLKKVGRKFERWIDTVYMQLSL